MAGTINGLLQNIALQGRTLGAQTMMSKGYTLWLMPKNEIYKKFAQLIKKLGAQYGGPVFEPHVTLLGDIELPEEEMTKRTAQLVEGQKPFSITLKIIDYQDFYFRTLFVRAEINNMLQTLHDRAKKIFKMDIPPFMAHLSILYGNYPQDIKEKIIQEIGRNQTAQFEVNSIFLIKGGEVEEWKIIKEFTFKP